jgi:hypothetical protein
MKTPTTPGTILLPSLKIELKADGRLCIYPNKANPGSAVVVDPAKLERWARRIYRDEVLR